MAISTQVPNSPEKSNGEIAEADFRRSDVSDVVAGAFRKRDDRFEALVAAAEGLAREGKFNAAEPALREALALAADDPERLIRILRALPARHFSGLGDPLALLVAQSGLAMQHEDGPARTMLMARLAAELSYNLETRGQAAQMGADALERITRWRDSAIELQVRLYLDQLLRGPSQVAERLTNADRLFQLAAQACDFETCWMAALAKAGALVMMGERFAAEHALQFAHGILRSGETGYQRGLAAMIDIHNAVVDGHFSNAALEFHCFRKMAESAGISCLLDACWPNLLIPLDEANRLTELEELAENAAQRRRSNPLYTALLSWLKVRRGDLCHATFLFEQLAASEFASLAGCAEELIGMSVLAEVCAALERPDCALILYRHLLPYRNLCISLNAMINFGSVARPLGKLAATLGRWDDAVEHFDFAMRADRRNGYRIWTIFSTCELADALAHRGLTGDNARALDLVAALEVEVKSLNLSCTEQQLSKICKLLSRGLLQESHAANQSIAFREHETDVSAESEDNFSRRSDVESEINLNSVGKLSRPFPKADGMVAIFSCNGEFWNIGYQGYTISLRHRRGFDYISLLLRHPDRDFFALELAHEGEMSRNTENPIDIVAEPILDNAAKRAYRERILELQDDLKRAHGNNDHDCASKLEEELSFLERELGRSLGLFGRDRKFSSEAERARKRVSVAISRAMRLISAHQEHFGRYLERSIRTGSRCCYIPDRVNPVRWVF